MQSLKRASRVGTATVVAVFALLLLAAFGGARWGLLGPLDTETAITAPEGRLEAPAFELRDQAGEQVTLADFRGKAVLLHFWATWCSACCAEIPWLNEIQQEYWDQEFTIVSVSLDEDGWEAVAPFVKEHGLEYPVFVADKDASAVQEISVVPTMFFVDRDGRVAFQHKGPMGRSELEQTLEGLISEPSWQAADDEP